MHHLWCCGIAHVCLEVNVSTVGKKLVAVLPPVGLGLHPQEQGVPSIYCAVRVQAIVVDTTLDHQSSCLLFCVRSW